MAEPTSVPPVADPADDTQPNEVQELRDQLAERERQINELSGNVRALNEHVMRAAEPRPAPVEPPKPLTQEEIEADPQGALDRHFESRITPLKDAQLERDAAINRELAARHLPDWEKYEKEVEVLAKRLSPEARAHPDAWRQLHNMARMEHIDDIKQAAVEAAKAEWQNERAVASGEGTPTAGSPPQKPAGPTPLTAEEKAVARKFGMSEEEYASERDALATDARSELRRRLGIEE